MRTLAIKLAGIGLAATAALLLGGCNLNSVGYVELRALPGVAAITPPPLYLNAVRLGALKNGVAVLQQAVGLTKLQYERNGELHLACEFTIRRNRIVTVTVSVFDRTPRCDVRN